METTTTTIQRKVPLKQGNQYRLVLTELGSGELKGIYVGNATVTKNLRGKNGKPFIMITIE